MTAFTMFLKSKAYELAALSVVVLALLAGLVSALAAQENETQTPAPAKRKIIYGGRVLRPLMNGASSLAGEDKYDEAVSLMERALTLVRNDAEPDKLTLSLLLKDLAFIQYTKGDYAGAEGNYQLSFVALDEWRRSLPVIMPTQDTGPLTISKLSPEERVHRALLAQAQGDVAKALQLLSSVDQDREKDFIFVSNYISENEKLQFMGAVGNETDLTISCHVRSAPNDLEAASIALTAVLHRKGRVLDALSESMQRLRENLTPDDLRLIKELAKARTQLAALVLNSTASDDTARLQAESARLRANVQMREKALSERSAKYQLWWESVTLKRIQQAIPAGAVLVEIISYKPFNANAKRNAERWGAPHYIAYILGREGAPAWEDLGARSVIDADVLRLRATLKRPPSTDINTPAHRANLASLKRAARSLDERLMRPIRKHIGEARTILISPDGMLNLVPFATLVDERDRYLIENYSFRYLTSGRDLLRLEKRAPSRQAPFIIADPAFNDIGSTVAPAVETSCSADATRTEANDRFVVTDKADDFRRDSNNQLSRNFTGITFDAASISFTSLEARDVCALLPRANVLTGAQAIEAALKKVAAPSILHIATHGFFLPDTQVSAGETLARDVWFDLFANSTVLSSTETLAVENTLLRAGLALAGANRRRSSGGEDGILTALEVSGLDLWGTKLVILSACSTGLGDVMNGEGIFGLRRALLVAGSESQVISLWNVNDVATRNLIVEYYKRVLQRREGKSEALHEVQRSMLKSNTVWSHPYYWAGFIQSGDWSAINLN